MVPVPTFEKVMVPVPTFEKLRFQVPAPYLDHKKQIFQEKFWNFFAFLPTVPSKLFYNEKVYKLIVKCE
jgi:hypothetical protein